MIPDSLFPSSDTRETGYLSTDRPHRIFWERRGRASGEPALVLHGGPGTGITENLFQIFDPERFDIIAFDQRGAGRSEPFGILDGNTLEALVSDIERLRRHLEVDRWTIVGGSWGTTLALCYAETFPASVARIILWGTWLFRPSDIAWYLHGARSVHMEAWNEFAAAVDYQEGDDLLALFADRLFDSDPGVHMRAAVAWKTFERRRGVLVGESNSPALPADRRTLNMARLMVHFCKAGSRGETPDILGNAAFLKGIPGTIVHGRYDMVCPFDNAVRLAQVWPDGRLVEIPDAGHRLDEPEIRRAVLHAIHR